MSKYFCTSLFLSLFLSFAALADNNIYTPYIGADYAFARAKASGIKPVYHSGAVNVGTKYNDYFGTELFYQQSGSESKKTGNGKYKSSYRAYGLDMAAYLPLTCDHHLDLLATAGVGEYVLSKKLSGFKHHNDSGIGYRFGGGVMFNLDENISLRVLARYIDLKNISGYDHMVEYSTGLRYHF